MERLLAVGVGALDREPDDPTLRAYIEVLDGLTVLCPFTEPVRLGWFILPTRGPSRFFGGEDAVLAAVRQCVRDVLDEDAMLGVADGLFCAELAARAALVVPVGATTSFRRSQPLEVLGRKDLATTCRRLGLHTVGAFADLERARVNERFSAAVVQLHRVACGELGELPGQRDPRLERRLRAARDDERLPDEQRGFFGQRGAADDRALAAVHRVRRRLGADAVVVAEVRGGRVPEDRAALVPWGSPPGARDDAPWPGRFCAPSPAATLAHRVSNELLDGDGRDVTVNSRGSLSAAPSRMLLARTWCDVVWHAGPWPLWERWWASNRRRAHLQVLLATGEAMLLVTEGGRWWVVGVYD